MSVVLIIVHVVVCAFLVLVVLLQTGKGADMGAVFGGSSATIFGSSGAGNLLTKLTTAAAAIFMVTSLTLTYVSTKHLSASVFDTPSSEPPPIEAPPAAGEPPAAGAPAAEAPAPAAAPQAAAPEAAAPEAAAPAGAPEAAAPAAADGHAAAQGEEPPAGNN